LKSQVYLNVAFVSSFMDGNRCSSLELLKIFNSVCFFFIVKRLTVLSKLSFNVGMGDYLECTTLYVCVIGI